MAGAPFEATIATRGSSSRTRPDRSDVRVDGLVADVRVFDDVRGAILTLDRGVARFRTENGPKSLPGYMARTDLSEYRLDESVCLKRGHCGPFLNRGVYDAFPDPRWHGMGECVHCHSTVKISRHEARARSV